MAIPSPGADNHFARALSEAARRDVAEARLSRDGRWIRCNHHGCHHALGTLVWDFYPAHYDSDLNEAPWDLRVPRDPRGLVPYELLLLCEGWDLVGEVWRASEVCQAEIRRTPHNLNVVGLGGLARIVVWSPQQVWFRADGRDLLEPCRIRNGDGARDRQFALSQRCRVPTSDQLGYSLDQWPEMKQVVECGWCRSLVTVDLARMSRELRPLGWEPGTKYWPE